MKSSLINEVGPFHWSCGEKYSIACCAGHALEVHIFRLNHKSFHTLLSCIPGTEAQAAV